jgi:tetratricopeptide (TPR) repeat protein
LNPKSTDAYCNRGIAYSQTDKIALAIKDYDATLKIDPNDGVVYYNRAKAHFAIQNRKKVVADLENAAKYAEK